MNYAFCALIAIAVWKVGEAIIRNRREAFEEHLKHIVSEQGHRLFRQPARDDYWKLSERIDALEKKAANGDSK